MPMNDTYMDYQALVHKALRGALREILLTVYKDGLKGEHHYYITFKTEFEGVKIPKRLKAQYPQEMTIVIQHRYWDLKIHKDRFEIGLSFNQRPEHLIIPFEAITSLVDPSVRFALQFDAEEVEGEEGQEDIFAAMPEITEQQEEKSKKPAEEAAEKAQDNVVPLDAFRKN